MGSGFFMLGGSGNLTSARPVPTVSDIGKAPLQRALQVTISDFMDPSGEVLQSTR